jgi:hypothetical protein
MRLARYATENPAYAANLRVVIPSSRLARGQVKREMNFVFHRFTAPQIRVPHTPGFPVNLVGVDEPLAAFLNESRTRGDCLVPRTGNPVISPAFGEMWEMKQLSRTSLPSYSALPRKHQDFGSSGELVTF